MGRSARLAVLLLDRPAEQRLDFRQAAPFCDQGVRPPFLASVPLHRPLNGASQRLPSSNWTSRCLPLSRNREISDSTWPARQASEPAPPVSTAFAQRSPTRWQQHSRLPSRISNIASVN